MKYCLIFFLMASVICSCRQSAIRASFSGADSLVVHFKNEKAGFVSKTVQTTEAKAIKKIIGFIDAPVTEDFNPIAIGCGYDGKMFFYSGQQMVQEVDFQMNDNACRHFSFLLEGKLMSTAMSNEAVDFFAALEKGMSYY